jgi:uncharacterized protein YlxW (UPF0749 family)
MKTVIRLALACALLGFTSVSAAAGVRDQLEENLAGGSSLFRQKLQLLAEQKNLAGESKTLNATGNQLNQEQGDLNRQADTHNQQVADQKAQIDKTRKGCGNDQDDSSGTQAADACNDSAKSLNQKTVDINAGVGGLQAKQDSLATRFAQYQKAVDDWNRREQANIVALNRINKRLDNWLNFSYNFMAGADFQAAVVTSYATPTCGEGTSRIAASASAPLDESARFILACLKSVKKGLSKPTG